MMLTRQTLCIFCTLVAAVTSDQQLPNIVAIVGQPFTYSIAKLQDVEIPSKVTEIEKDFLPSWLSYDPTSRTLQGVPSWRDKGTYTLQAGQSSIHHFDVVVSDFSEAVANSLHMNGTKTPVITRPHCVDRMPVTVATIVFDVKITSLSGDQRIKLLQKVATVFDVEMEKLHLVIGKGHNTAFGLKDVMILTAGPGDVTDAKEPGVAVSWQIGCGNNIAELDKNQDLGNLNFSLTCLKLF